ncbi:MAG: hypothetical protein K9J13_02370 [Saprospiraceae bacterium]|nr:hypothetical protein [Saprospiraceae bacterium]
MKKIIGLLLILSIIAGCTSSKKYLQRRQYDAAINKSVNKLVKKPTKTKQINILRDAYRLANQQDNDRIKFLRQSGQPDIWDEVFVKLNNMKVRQENVKRLPSSILANINFVPVDYDSEIISAKQKAAEYFYAHASSLLDRKEKFAARQAYDEFHKVKNYYSSYKDVDKKINEAYNYGMNYVLFTMQNKSGIMIPKNFESDLLKISLTNIAGKWVAFDTKQDNKLFYDYSIYLNLKVIDVSPEYVKEKEYVESKKVKDGYQYVKDSNGNVMKDSLGNDLKVPKYIEKKCYITEYYLSKKAIVSGTLDFWNNRTKQLIKTDPVTTEFFFEHRFAEAKGDRSVLKKETLKLVKTRPLPFPPDLDMIYRTNENLKEMTKSIIVRNRSLVEN